MKGKTGMHGLYFGGESSDYGGEAMTVWKLCRD